MKQRDSFRGNKIDNNFADQFKQSKFYTEIYNKHKDEIIIGIRDGYINLYHNCNSIAKISTTNPTACDIDPYYTDGNKKTLSADDLVNLYATIKDKSEGNNSDRRKKLEKQAQQRLYIDNNSNAESNWYCVDVEYTKSIKGKATPEGWRFDIIAITKKAPFRVALIELKYGSNAIGGKSGIRTHVKDFYEFYKNGYFNKYLKEEIASIINSLDLVGVDIPESLKGIKASDIQNQPEFYFITLNNNPEKIGGSTPMQTMGGYLFKDKWETKKNCAQVENGEDFYHITGNDQNFKPTFLFSKAVLPSLNIKDILDFKNYDKKGV